MALALAHALELPGKMRLDRDHYLAVQTIYYPGFALAGAAEPLAILSLAALLAFEPVDTSTFRLAAGALAAMATTQLLFWTVVQPVNRYWLQATRLTGSAERFFHAGAGAEMSDWTRMRDRWERGHLARAATSGIAFLLCLLLLVEP
jgi:hypothetical protein